MRRLTIIAASAILLASCSGNTAVTDLTRATRVTPEDEYYIFTLNENVTRTHVYYDTKFGIELAADLYTSKDLDTTQKYPAIIIGPPYGGVKEQGPGVYANELARRGFIAIAFDPAYHGYSGGHPRYTTSSSTYAEDFLASVDFAGSLNYVDRNKISVLGICGSGGFAISAASMDSRIKAVMTSAMYDIAGFNNSVGGDMRKGMIEMASQQRWADQDSGEEPKAMIAYPDHPLDELPAEISGTNIEWWTFYATKRGWHPNARGNSTIASMPDMMTLPGTNHIADISPRPILFITGDIAHSRAFSEEAYARASEPKELYITPGAMHIDLYDDTSKIPFDKIEQFLKDHLN